MPKITASQGETYTRILKIAYAELPFKIVENQGRPYSNSIILRFITVQKRHFDWLAKRMSFFFD
jgi:hypothetical protein